MAARVDTGFGGRFKRIKDWVDFDKEDDSSFVREWCDLKYGTSAVLAV